MQCYFFDDTIRPSGIKNRRDRMLLELKDVHKSFSEKPVLKGVSFSAKGGSAFGLLGRNGAGKTTTIRILMNVFAADSGAVEIDGKPIDYRKIKLGYLPEERGMYPKRKVKEQLVYFAMLKGLSKSEAVSAVDHWLKRMGMTKEAGRKLETLSKGNQQKIQLITALSHNPDVIALDEPFSGLDPVNAKLLKDVVAEQIWLNKIVIFSSHQMNYVEEFCDRVAIIQDGKIALNGDLYRLKKSLAKDKLRIRTSETDKMLDTLGDRCEKVNAHEIVFSLKDPSLRKEAMGYLVSHFDIDEIGVYEPSLNEIFIQYTQGKFAAGKEAEGERV